MELPCDCDGEKYLLANQDQALSICSTRATSRGRGQRVVSYSLFGSLSDGGRASYIYEEYVTELLQNVKEKYPSWVMRIYTNYDPDIPDQREWMCGIQCNQSHVDFCFVDRLPQLGNITRVQDQGMTWRFLPGMDPLVDIFVSRDTDSLVTNREREAVDEWLDSNSMIHAMRDHPHHPWHILGGMWGAKTIMNRSLMANLTREMILKTDLQHGYGFDQEVLRLVHDSYHCTKPEFQGPEYRPFPKQREGGYFVGWARRFDPAESLVLKFNCTPECRPKDHQDWVFC
ncbi:unnamed protein product [Darwinula stevensoni]|uniref:Uncharacterized protein n=1 Tax=Darwinula stevensoni TaxID=69355 RepID=A0A7R9FRH6_9CRUS|nr:unnamed protein product [Darwinula stevensoni]CAG0901313.1 unnamed protein product [Darwinula stevensoni]